MKAIDEAFIKSGYVSIPFTFKGAALVFSKCQKLYRLFGG